ncbi:DNA polymerase [Pseudomonas oryzihabitans]|uniref:DNA polymerase n=1 Tax=Pseudomonas oryzihabitans TaxID=47885 RepID=UPI001472793B|nr:DNA polymerase [Pseudomonas oryzihabitans]NMZ63410.1 DNA polymerase [Pseudomonas oryzihabitans]
MLISDIETNGLLETVSKFHCGVTTDYHTRETIKYRPGDFLAYIKALEAEAAKPDGLIVFHNGIKYDHPALDKLKRALTGKRLNIPRQRVFDTLVASRLVYANIRDRDGALVRSGKLPGKMFGHHSLKAWGYRLGVLKGTYGEGEGNVWEHFSEEMLDYCVQDVQVTTLLMQKLLEDPFYFPSVAPNGELWMGSIHAVRLEHQCAWTLAQMERNGFPFNREAAERLFIELAARRSDLLVKLIKTFGSWFAPKAGTEHFKHPKTGRPLENYPRVKYPKVGGIWCGEGKKRRKDKRETVEGAPYTPIEQITFNPASRPHLVKVLKDAGWVPEEFTENGAPKVDDDVLEGVKVDDPKAQAAIELVREYLMIQKRIGQLAEGDKAWMLYDRDGKIHGSVNPNGAVTGRATHSHPNMGQVPSSTAEYGPACRDLFGAKYAGWFQVGIDASGLELRCLGHFGSPFDDGVYAETVLNGDIHWVNGIAAGICPDEPRDKHNDYHEARRAIAKTFIYAFLYGAGDAKVGGFVEGGKAEGKALKKSFLENTPAISKLREALEESLLASQTWNPALKKFDIKWKRRWIKGLDGRKVHVRSPHSALNTLLQSAGALVCKAWVVELERLLIEECGLVHGWEGDFCFMAWVHDEVQIAARTKEIAELVAEMGQKAMRNVQHLFAFRCQLDTEAKHGGTWKDCH